MTIGQTIATIIGSALFPIGIRLVWGKMVEDFGPAGGWMAAAFVVGTLWSLNHGLTNPMITQTGFWVDMALAGGVGVYTTSLIHGGKVKGSLSTILAALIGGILAGLVLALFL